MTYSPRPDLPSIEDLEPFDIIRTTVHGSTIMVDLKYTTDTWLQILTAIEKPAPTNVFAEGRYGEEVAVPIATGCLVSRLSPMSRSQYRKVIEAEERASNVLSGEDSDG